MKNVFIDKFNKQFSVEPACSEKAYRRNIFGSLDRIFCKKERRKIGVGNIFSYDSLTWLINEKFCYRGREVNINTHIDGSQSFDIMGKEVYPRLIKSQRVYGHNKQVV